MTSGDLKNIIPTYFTTSQIEDIHKSYKTHYKLDEFKKMVNKPSCWSRVSKKKDKASKHIERSFQSESMAGSNIFLQVDITTDEKDEMILEHDSYVCYYTNGLNINRISV